MDRPVLVGGSGDLEHATERSDRVIGLLHLDEPTSAHRISLAKKVAAFLRIVRSSSRTRTWRRRRVDASRSAVLKPLRVPPSISARCICGRAPV